MRQCAQSVGTFVRQCEQDRVRACVRQCEQDSEWSLCELV